MKALTILAIALVVSALIFSTCAAAPSFTISITRNGITYTPKSLPSGDHVIMIKNMTSMARGLEMVGTDKGGSPFIRFSKILKPGKSETFRWFFPAEKTVYLRDITSCEHRSRTCVIVSYGGMVTAVTPM
jgi:hypothetical protein